MLEKVWGVAQWQNTCLACSRPLVPIQYLKPTKQHPQPLSIWLQNLPSDKRNSPLIYTAHFSLLVGFSQQNKEVQTPDSLRSLEA